MNRQFAVFISIIQAILFFGHWLLYFSAVSMIDIPDSPVRVGLRIAIGLLSISFVTASIYSFVSDSILSRWYYSFAAVWLGVLHCLILASIAGWILILVANAADLLLPAPVFGLGVYTFGVLLAAFALIRTYAPRISRVSVALKNLPSNWKGKKLVWVSDVHLGHIRRQRFARRVVKRIEKLAPELVFIGGDLFDGGRINAEAIMQPFTDLASRHDVLFVTGNHELFSGHAAFVAIVRSKGITVLEEEKVERDGLQIAGVGWPASRSSDRMSAALTKMQLDPERSTILLVHSPDQFETAQEAGIALQISGHTHRGQIWPFSLITRRVYHGFDYGLKKYRDMWAYTSSGTGTWGPPMRLGSPSEIVEITLT